VSEGDIELIREQYDAVNRRDFDRVMELYADDVVLIAPWMEGIQNPGTYTGKEAVGEWFGDWFRTFAHGYRFDLDEFRDLGGGLIMMHAEHGGEGRLSGAPVRSENAYLYRVQDGRISKVGFFATREEALEAASQPEWSEAKTD
jgi:ketosteroid isomerase-like protein